MQANGAAVEEHLLSIFEGSGGVEEVISNLSAHHFKTLKMTHFSLANVFELARIESE